MGSNIQGTLIGTVITAILALLSLPEISGIIPLKYLPFVVIFTQVLMFLKKWFLPADPPLAQAEKVVASQKAATIPAGRGKTWFLRSFSHLFPPSTKGPRALIT
jgi:hypothetical protein